MKNKFPLLCYCFILFFSTTIFAQQDPFASNMVDAAALSPSELPSFNEYKTSPENIQISSISPKELDAVILSTRERFFILDARSRAEYDISHIDKAKHIGFNDFTIERVWMVDRKARVIVYSTTGDRALIIAQYLKLMGFLDIQILENSIIGWKNEGFNVVDNNKSLTNDVHVYKKENTKLLKKGKAIL